MTISMRMLAEVSRFLKLPCKRCVHSYWMELFTYCSPLHLSGILVFLLDLGKVIYYILPYIQLAVHLIVQFRC